MEHFIKIDSYIINIKDVVSIQKWCGDVKIILHDEVELRIKTKDAAMLINNIWNEIWSFHDVNSRVVKID